MIRAVLLSLGTVFLGLGIVGVVVPGLPTTPFILLAAAFYVRSSERMYSWLLNHRIFGKIVGNFQSTKSISLPAKVISIAVMWVMILLSIFLFIDKRIVEIVIASLGVIGTVVLLVIPTTKTS